MSAAAAGPETIDLASATPPMVVSVVTQVATDGLRPGDANRDGMVNLTDLSSLPSPANYNKPGGLDQGDFNSDGRVNVIPTSHSSQSCQLQYSATPPAIGCGP